MKLPEQLAFLKSVRFWKLFLVAVAQFLGAQGIIDKTIVDGLSLLLLGSVVVRTVDRAAEKVSPK